jgi:hypothetical protein
MIEVRAGRRSPYRVRRLEGRLSSSFRVKAAAELQDALWRRWGDQIPVLADREPKLPPALEARLLSPGRRELSTVLLAELLAAHPARNDKRAPATEDAPLLGEYIVDFFPKWAEGKVVLRGASDTPKARKTIEIVQDGLHRIVFETRWERDEHGWRLRDEAGRLVDLGWGKDAAAWIPLRNFDMEHVLALAEKVDEEGIGKEIWRKVRSFLKQLIDYAKLRNDYPRDRAHPVTLVRRRPSRACGSFDGPTSPRSSRRSGPTSWSSRRSFRPVSVGRAGGPWRLPPGSPFRRSPASARCPRISWRRCVRRLPTGRDPRCPGMPLRAR